MVAIAWRRLYGRWPRPWEAVCIALHDVGHIGLDYLDDPEAKAKHWCLGAIWALYLFGSKGWALCAGHSGHSGEPRSMLYKADKLSWTIAPMWWLLWQQVVEPKLNQSGMSRREHARRFREWAIANCEGRWSETHSAVEELSTGPTK